MITKATGRLSRLGEDQLTLAVGAFEYEVLIPSFVRRQMSGLVGQEVSLFTLEYLEGNPMQGRVVPRLIGFLTEAERQFFDLICSVDGVGVRKALRAMVRPVKEVAVAIEEQDVKTLSTLPGVGEATAERIIAKLRRKVAKFALMVEPAAATGETPVPPDVVEEAHQALVTLGHSSAEARRLLDSVLAGGKKFKSAEELLQAIYQQHRG